MKDGRLVTLQLFALLNLLAVAYFGNPHSNEQTLEWLLILFSLGFTSEFSIWGSRQGWRNVLVNDNDPEQQIVTWLSAMIICISFVGACLLLMDPDHDVIAAKDARTLTAFSVLLLITLHRQFGRILLSFCRAAATCLPVIVAIFFFVVIFALASKDIYGDTVVDSNTNTPYFDTFSRSLATMFRMFSGDWHGIMYEAAAVTTEASQLWFTAYVFLLTVFCNNLLVGVVMAQYAEVDTIESPRLYGLLSSSFGFGPQKQTKVMNAMLTLNHNLRKYDRVVRQSNGLDKTTLRSTELEVSTDPPC